MAVVELVRIQVLLVAIFAEMPVVVDLFRALIFADNAFVGCH